MGFNLQSSERHRTRALVQFDRPEQTALDVLGFLETEGRSAHAEIRHDARLGDRHLLSVGAATGRRRFDTNNLFLAPPPPPGFPSFPDIRNQTRQSVRTRQLYVRDEFRAGSRLTLTGELKLSTLDRRLSSRILSPPGLPATPDFNQDTAVGLPSFIVAYQPNPRTGIRLRARKLFGTIRDFELLAPTDVFLFSLSEVPETSFAGRGESLELEYDHTFGNASFLRLGLFQQNLRDASNVVAEQLSRARFRGARIRYEGVLSRMTTFFLNADFNDTAGIVNFGAGVGASQNEFLSNVPRFAAEAGLQFLNRDGWFVQPSYGYQGARFQPFTGPVAGVNIGLWKLGEQQAVNTVQTDAQGEYSLRNVKGRFLVRPKSNGHVFVPEEREVKVGNNQVVEDEDFAATALVQAQPDANLVIDALFFRDVLRACAELSESLAAEVGLDAAKVEITRLLRQYDVIRPAFFAEGDAEGDAAKGDAAEGDAAKGDAAEGTRAIGEKRLLVLCSVCRNRYYTPGTIYYMNYPALVTCMNNPPCS